MKSEQVLLIHPVHCDQRRVEYRATELGFKYLKTVFLKPNKTETSPSERLQSNIQGKQSQSREVRDEKKKGHFKKEASEEKSKIYKNQPPATLNVHRLSGDSTTTHTRPHVTALTMVCSLGLR